MADGRRGALALAAGAVAAAAVLASVTTQAPRPEVLTAPRPAASAPVVARTPAAVVAPRRTVAPAPRRTRAVAARQAPRSAAPVEVPRRRAAPRGVPQVGRVEGTTAPRPVRTARPRTGNARVVVGLDDYLFISQDWTVACQYDGRADEAAAAVEEVTRVLRESGRPTVLAIGPNKSSVLLRQVPAEGVPQRECAERSAAAYWEALDRDGGPSVLDLRPALRRQSETEQTYWRLDTHWSPTAGTVFARELAQRLDPSLLVALGSERGTYRLDGDLARTLGQPEVEEISALATTNTGVSFRELPPRDVGLRNVVRATVAEVGPGGRVVPGRTVFVGDSFTAIAVEQLAPLFEEAVFVWAIPGDPLRPVLDQLEGADTVVIESVERVGWQFRMIQPDVAPALRELPPRR